MQEVYSKVTNHLLLPLLHKAPGNSSSYPTKSAWESKCLWVRVDGCFRSPSWDPLPVPYQKQLQFRINLGDWRSQSTTLFLVHHNGSAFSYFCEWQIASLSKNLIAICEVRRTGRWVYTWWLKKLRGMNSNQARERNTRHSVTICRWHATLYRKPQHLHQ